MKKNSPSGANALVIKDLNTRLVRQALKNARVSTVRDLAGMTGLSTVTVAGIVQALVAGGAAREGELVPSNGGRPSRLYRFDEHQASVLVLFTREIEGRDTACLRVADLYGQIVASENHPLEAGSLEAFEPFIDRMLVRFPSISALGFGLPGIEYGGTIVALDYHKLVGAPIIDHFQSRYGIPVVFENDVNAAVLGRGRQEGAATSEAYLYFPRKYPPGSGIRIEGRLLKGSRHFAGEVGFLPLGIAWGDPNLTESIEASSSAAAQVIVSLAAVLDPESVVLFGEFLTPTHLAEIRIRCRSLMPEESLPQISLTEDFTQDFQDGLVGLTLELLDL